MGVGDSRYAVGASDIAGHDERPPPSAKFWLERPSDSNWTWRQSTGRRTQLHLGPRSARLLPLIYGVPTEEVILAIRLCIELRMPIAVMAGLWRCYTVGATLSNTLGTTTVPWIGAAKALGMGCSPALAARLLGQLSVTPSQEPPPLTLSAFVAAAWNILTIQEGALLRYFFGMADTHRRGTATVDALKTLLLLSYDVIRLEDVPGLLGAFSSLLEKVHDHEEGSSRGLPTRSLAFATTDSNTGTATGEVVAGMRDPDLFETFSRRKGVPDTVVTVDEFLSHAAREPVLAGGMLALRTRARDSVAARALGFKPHLRSPLDEARRQAVQQEEHEAVRALQARVWGHAAELEAQTTRVGKAAARSSLRKAQTELSTALAQARRRREEEVKAAVAERAWEQLPRFLPPQLYPPPGRVGGPLQGDPVAKYLAGAEAALEALGVEVEKDESVDEEDGEAAAKAARRRAFMGQTEQEPRGVDEEAASAGAVDGATNDKAIAARAELAAKQRRVERQAVLVAADSAGPGGPGNAAKELDGPQLGAVARALLSHKAQRERRQGLIAKKRAALGKAAAAGAVGGTGYGVATAGQGGLRAGEMWGLLEHDRATRVAYARAVCEGIATALGWQVVASMTPAPNLAAETAASAAGQSLMHLPVVDPSSGSAGVGGGPGGLDPQPVDYPRDPTVPFLPRLPTRGAAVYAHPTPLELRAAHVWYSMRPPAPPGAGSPAGRKRAGARREEAGPAAASPPDAGGGAADAGEGKAASSEGDAPARPQALQGARHGGAAAVRRAARAALRLRLGGRTFQVGGHDGDVGDISEAPRRSTGAGRKAKSKATKLRQMARLRLSDITGVAGVGGVAAAAARPSKHAPRRLNRRGRGLLGRSKWPADPSMPRLPLDPASALEVQATVDEAVQAAPAAPKDLALLAAWASNALPYIVPASLASRVLPETAAVERSPVAESMRAGAAQALKDWPGARLSGGKDMDGEELGLRATRFGDGTGASDLDASDPDFEGDTTEPEEQESDTSGSDSLDEAEQGTAAKTAAAKAAELDDEDDDLLDDLPDDDAAAIREAFDDGWWFEREQKAREAADVAKAERMADDKPLNVRVMLTDAFVKADFDDLKKEVKRQERDWMPAEEHIRRVRTTVPWVQPVRMMRLLEDGGTLPSKASLLWRQSQADAVIVAAGGVATAARVSLKSRHRAEEAASAAAASGTAVGKPEPFAGAALEAFEGVVSSAAEWALIGAGQGAEWIMARLRHSCARAVFELLRVLPTGHPTRPPARGMIELRRAVWLTEREEIAAHKTLLDFVDEVEAGDVEKAVSDARDEAMRRVATDLGLQDEVKLRAKKAKWIMDNWRKLNPAAPESERPPPITDAAAIRQARAELVEAEAAKVRAAAEDRFARIRGELEALEEQVASLAERAVLLASVEQAERQAKESATSDEPSAAAPDQSGQAATAAATGQTSSPPK